MKTLRASILALSWLVLCQGTLAQMLQLPLEVRPGDTPPNLQAQRGVPISTTTNVPPGSDGRMTTIK